MKFKIKFIKASLCYYSDAYILVKGTIKFNGSRKNMAARHADEKNKNI